MPRVYLIFLCVKGGVTHLASTFVNCVVQLYRKILIITLPSLAIYATKGTPKTADDQSSYILQSYPWRRVSGSLK